MIVGIGTDLIEIERIKQVGIPRIAKRILTAKELNSLPTTSHRQLETIAGRFVAKEAIAKALGCGIGKHFSFYDAQIICDEMGKPHATLSQKVIEHFFAEKEIRVHLSITHSRDMASAFVVIEQIQ